MNGKLNKFIVYGKRNKFIVFCISIVSFTICQSSYSDNWIEVDKSVSGLMETHNYGGVGPNSILLLAVAYPVVIIMCIMLAANPAPINHLVRIGRQAWVFRWLRSCSEIVLICYIAFFGVDVIGHCYRGFGLGDFFSKEFTLYILIQSITYCLVYIIMAMIYVLVFVVASSKPVAVICSLAIIAIVSIAHVRFFRFWIPFDILAIFNKTDSNSSIVMIPIIGLVKTMLLMIILVLLIAVLIRRKDILK